MYKSILNKPNLTETHPSVASEWHPTKNENLSPNQFTYGSNTKVWWLCSTCGHEWKAAPGTRTQGHGCSVCGRKKAAKSKSQNSASLGNSIAEKNPSLSKEWDYSRNPPERTPQNVSPWSGQKYYWICPDCGESYLSSVTNRTSGEGCPVCGQVMRGRTRRKTEVSSKGSLAELMPDLAAEWDYELNLQEHQIDPSHPATPNDVTVGSPARVWWCCPRGHKYPAIVYSRKAGNGCSICDTERKSSFPEQAIFYYLKQVVRTESRFRLNKTFEVDIYLPDQRIAIEYDGEAWHQDLVKDLRKNQLCSEEGIRLIRVRETGCPEISGECILVSSRSEDDLRKAIQMICKILGKSVDINIARDRSAIYAQYLNLEKDNSLAVLYPDLSAQWHPTKNGSLTPQLVAPQSNKQIWWLCSKGHVWETKVYSRVKGSGCPVCDGKRVLPGFNDLASRNPKLASEWHPTLNGNLKASQITPNSHKKVWWLGSCGHAWDAIVKSRNKGNGCPYCSGYKVLAGFNDLASNNPALSVEWHPDKNGDLLPAMITSHSNKRVWWQCVKGHEWQAAVADRNGDARHQTGCPVCSGKIKQDIRY